MKKKKSVDSSVLVSLSSAQSDALVQNPNGFHGPVLLYKKITVAD